jgi:hypothetical protein
VGAVVTANGTAAREWARAAVTAALTVPAHGREADVWAARGLADVALASALLGGPEAYAELDRAVREARIPAAGPVAARLRRLRALGGPVPDHYPEPIALGRAASVRPPARRAAALLVEFCDAVATVCLDRTHGPFEEPLPADTPEQLRWGRRYRPSPGDVEPVVVRRPLPRGLMWRSWFRLPWAGDTRTVVVERPSRDPAIRRLIWRGVHDGAHLDHITALTGLTDAAPSPVEFGWGLAVAESYAMAVEITATVASLLGGDLPVTAELRRGLLERVRRLTEPDITEFTALPALAEAYVVGPLRLLSGGSLGPLLPGSLTEPLKRRWDALAAAFPAAANLTRAARNLESTVPCPP